MKFSKNKKLKTAHQEDVLVISIVASFRTMKSLISGFSLGCSTRDYFYFLLVNGNFGFHLVSLNCSHSILNPYEKHLKVICTSQQSGSRKNNWEFAGRSIGLTGTQIQPRANLLRVRP